MLHGILAIGPLARLDRRFLPLLYNRRHLDVAGFLVAAHGVLSILQFHTLGDTNPLVSLFRMGRWVVSDLGGTANPRYGSLASFPFQRLGFAGLVIRLLMPVNSQSRTSAGTRTGPWARGA